MHMSCHISHKAHPTRTCHVIYLTNSSITTHTQRISMYVNAYDPRHTMTIYGIPPSPHVRMHYMHARMYSPPPSVLEAHAMHALTVHMPYPAHATRSTLQFLKTALMRAAETKRLKVVEFLLQHGANIFQVRPMSF